MLVDCYHSLVHILQKLWEIVEFWYQLFHIVRIVHKQFERLRNRMELTIGHIKTSTLQFNVQRCERFDAYQIVQHTGRIRVMCAIVEFRNDPSGIFETFVFGTDFCFVARIHHANRTTQIAERSGIVEVKHGACVVGKHPGKYRILTQIVVRSTRNWIQLHQIFEIRYFTVDPLLCESRIAQQFGRRSSRAVQYIRRLQTEYFREDFVACFSGEVQEVTRLIDKEHFESTASQVVFTQMHLFYLNDGKSVIGVCNWWGQSQCENWSKLD